MIAIEGIPRSMYHGPMLTNFSQGVPGFVPPSINGGLQHPGFYFGEQKVSGIPTSTVFPSNAVDETDKLQQQQQWKEALKQRKEYSTLKKVIVVLQDNRIKTGDPKTAAKLRELNRSQSESCPLLKTILNVLLVSTAVVLLVAVIIVIIYTSVKTPSVMPPQADNLAQEALQTDPNPPKPQPQPSMSHHVPDTASIFRTRTEVRHSNIRCRMVPVVRDEGPINMRQLCFEVGSNETI